MSRGLFLSKFKNYTQILVAAVEEKTDLEFDHPSLYENLITHYKDQEVYFYEDQEKNYDVVIDKLEYDLLNSGVMG
jgi:hypothetical protein|tara:strand:+ start:8342 stop:8569 length:228 start_codon:yes stop_codon:yes gene_type:complete